MNLGFDFDKIFIDYPPFIPSSLIDRLYKKKNTNAVAYRIPSKPEQIFRVMTHHPLLRPIIKENMMFIKSLRSKNHHKQYLISSRFGFLKKRTETVVKKHSFDKIFDELFFNFQNEQPHLFKNKVIKKLNIHRYVDDDLDLLEYLLSKNTNIKFFWINKKHDGFLKKNLFAITKLSSILK